MMRRAFIASLLLSVLIKVTAQEKPDKVEALRVSYITRHVAFTEQEGQKFWPVYNEYHNKLRVLRRKLRQTHRQYNESLTEEETRTLAAAEMELRESELKVHQVYSAAIVGILGHRKYMRLRLAEEQFRREMLKTLRDRDE